MRKRAKVDQTHGEVVTAFRSAGWPVLSLAPLGNGAPDLLVYGRRRIGGLGCYLIEVKRPKGKLRVAQELFGARWPVTVLRSADDVFNFIGLAR